MEPNLLLPIEDYFIDDELFGNSAFQKKVLPINLFSFKHRKFQMELFGENSELIFSAELSFEKPEITLGRKNTIFNNDWNFLEDMKTISRLQASLILEYDKVYLKNLPSASNSTAFRVRTFSPIELKNGQKIKIGKNIMIFSFPNENPEKLEYEIYQEKKDDPYVNFQPVIWEKEGGVNFQIKSNLFASELRKDVGENHANIQIDGNKLKLAAIRGNITWAFLDPDNPKNNMIEIKGKEDLMFGEYFFTLKKTIVEKTDFLMSFEKK